MMVLGYLWGQKYYPIPYNLPRALFYVSTALALFVLVQYSSIWINPNSFSGNFIRIISLFIFVYLVFYKEKIGGKKLVTS
jgi:hypothetical protein